MNQKNHKQTQTPPSVTSRRTFLKAGTAAAGTALLSAAIKIPAAYASEKKQEEVQYLFVQTAKGAVQEKGRLTLKEVAPTMIFFSDRPKRIAGHMTTEDFVIDWKEDTAKNSFQADPPNATVSVFAKDHIVDAVFELKNPRLKGNNIIYDIDVLLEDEPLPSGPVSLFIDPIGGVRRRHRRRHRRHARHRHAVRH
jgi:hypothetical protein